MIWMIKATGLALVLFLLGCGQPSQEGKASRTLTYITSKEEFGGFGFIGEVRGSQFFENKFYISDSQNARVLRLDENLEPEIQMGRLGEGPGELLETASIFVIKDHIYVGGDKQQLLDFDNDGNLQNIIPLPGSQFQTRFVVWEEMFFISNRRDEKIIHVFDIQGKPLFQFGEPVDIKDPGERRPRNINNLGLTRIEGQDYIVSVNLTEPLISLYTMTGELAYRKNLEDHVAVEARLAYRDAKHVRVPSSRSSSIGLFPDIQIEGDRLYVLVTTLEAPTNILVFRLGKSNMAQEGIFQVDARLLDSFTPAPDGYFLINRANMLNIYKTEN